MLFREKVKSYVTENVLSPCLYYRTPPECLSFHLFPLKDLYMLDEQDKHCYSRLLELLVNVWAYHSARRIVYIDPETGFMQEHHDLKSRKGQMWIKFFQFTTLKAMDEDLAEESDSDQPKRRWLWPSTGEIFWQGTYDKERSLKHKEKEKKRQQSKDKIQRIRRRTHQKVIGKYVKPAVEETRNGTDQALRLLR